MKIVMVGQGAFGQKHLDGLKNIDGVEVVSLAGGRPESVEAVAKQYGIPHWTSDLAEVARSNPASTPPSSRPRRRCIPIRPCRSCEAGKHVEIEIPIADNPLPMPQRIDARRRKKTGLDRYGRAHAPVQSFAPVGAQQESSPASSKLQQLVVQTYFFRRKNINLEGKPRSWTDHLLWHHACHTVDLFQYQTGEVASDVFAIEGPHHPELGIAMDMAIGMKTPSGAVCNLSLSFNNDGPQGTFFRYICDNGTYIARYDDLFDGKENQIDLSDVAVSMNGIELQDREFTSAIREGREPNSSVAKVLPAMETLDRLEKTLG